MASEILIVDDEADIRDLVAGILEHEGFATRTARDSDTALAEIANRWEVALGAATRHPSTLAGMEELCREHGQTKPTPLLLHYEAGGYNCLHQDLYGEVAFPLQATIMLSAPDEDFTGGENVLVEQRPRAQSRPVVARLGRGQALLFPTRDRPVAGVEEQAGRVGDRFDPFGGEVEAPDLVGRPEAVLEGADEAERGLAVALELADHIHQVLEQAGARDGAVFGDVADEQHGEAAVFGDADEGARHLAHRADLE